MAGVGQGNAKYYGSVPRIDWSNPLTHGLIGAYLPGTLQGLAIVGPNLAVGDGGVGSRVMLKEGYALRSSTVGANTGLIAPAPTAFTGNAFSCYWRGRINGAPGDTFPSLIGVTYTNSDTDPFYGRMIACDSSDYLAIACHWNNAGVLANGTSIDVTGSYGVQPLSLCGTFLTGGNAILYKNGVSAASDAFGAGAPNYSGPQLFINQYVPGTPRTVNADCSLALFWNRQLSAGEVLRLDQNPHGFLIFPEEDMVAQLVGVVAAGGTPNNQYQWPNPNLPVTSTQYWLESTVYLIGKDSLPFRQRYWPNPNIPVYTDDYSWDDFFSLSLIGKDALPKNQYKWPNPELVPYRDDIISWYDYTPLTLLGKDSMITGKQRWDVPYGPTPPVRDWVAYLNPPAFPLVSIRTEVPLGPWSNPFWVDFLNPPGFPRVSTRVEVPIGPTTNPFWINYTLPFNYPVVVSTTPNVSVVWFVPIGPTAKITDWQDYIIPAGQDSLPIGEQRWIVPYGPIPPVRDWIDYLNPPGFPTVSIRTEVPYGPPPNPFWIDYVIPAGQDSLPTRQYVYDVPRGPYYPDQTFYQYVQPQAVVFFPEVGQVWFVPKGSDFKVSDYQSYIIPVGQDKLPLNQYNWPVPKGATPGQDWQLLYNNALNFVVQPGPPGVLFNQYSWPNPIILSIGNLDWQNFLTNIPQPSPVELISSGRYLTEADVEASKHVKWRYKEGADILYKHMAAVNLGRKGGIQSGKSRRSR